MLDVEVHGDNLARRARPRQRGRRQTVLPIAPGMRRRARAVMLPS
jgi:hypothetical protein